MLAMTIRIFAIVRVEDNDVVVDIEIEERAVVARYAKGVDASALPKFFDMQTRITPVCGKQIDLSFGEYAHMLREPLYRSVVVVGWDDLVHDLYARVAYFLVARRNDARMRSGCL